MRLACRCIFLLVFFLPTFNLVGQSIPFQLGYNGGSDEQFKCIVECTSGGFVAVGATKSFGVGNNDIFIVRIDRNGNVRWSRTIGTTGSDIGNGITSVDDHGFMIVGSSNYFHSNGTDDALIIRTDSNGMVLWSKTFGDTLPDVAESIMKTADGKFLVDGSSYDSTSGVSRDALQIKIDSLGNVSWLRTVGGGGSHETFYSSAELPGGSLINVGFTDNYAQSDGIIEKISAAGTYLWRKKFVGTGHEYFYDVALGLNGKVMAVGSTDSFGAGGFDVFMVSVDSMATNLISRTAGTNGTEFAYSISATTDSGFIVSGMTNGFASNGTYDPFIMKINSTGLVQWTNVYGTNYADAISSGLISSDGHYVFSGYSYGLSVGNNMAGYLIKTDTTGDGGCSTNSLTFTQTVNGIENNFASINTVLPNLLQTRVLISAPINNLQLNPLCLNGVGAYAESNALNLFPNPSDGEFNLTIDFPTDDNLQIEIYDVNGRIVFSKRNLVVGENFVDATNLPSGVYFLSLKNGNEISNRRKLIVARN